MCIRDRTDSEWKDCGQIQGPAGKDGKDGATGPQGPQGPAGKDGTQVDLSNYATKDQLATKADNTVVAPLSYGALHDGANLDDEKTSGTFFSIEEVTNGPGFSNGDLFVTWVVSAMSATEATTFTQMAFTQAGDMAIRNFVSGAGWGSWKLLANDSDVTTAISTATANMVDSSKPTNFTAGLQSGGVDVATAADLKSVEDSAWRQLDNKYISVNNGTLSSETTILFRLDQIAKKIYLQGTVLVKEMVGANIAIDFSGIIKTITSTDNTLQYWGNSPSNAYWATTTGSRINIATDDVGRATILHSGAGTTKTAACVTYDELA
mgnify:CR=1 FL=1